MWEFFERREVVARKSHVCEQCRTVITPGERYKSCAGKFDGDFRAYAEHVECFDAWHALHNRREVGWDETGPFLCNDSEVPVDDRGWLIEAHPIVAARLGFEVPAHG